MDVGIAEYRRRAQASNVVIVGFQDQSDLKKYLTGDINTCEQIDLSFAAQSANVQIEPAVPTQPVVEEETLTRLSKEQMEEERKRLNGLIDEILESSLPAVVYSLDEESKGISGTKRKTVPEFNPDPSFMKADHAMLMSQRTGEHPEFTRNTVLRRPGGEGFGFVLSLFNDHVLKFHGRPPEEQRRQNPLVPNVPIPKGVRIPSGPPIIIVPNSLTGAISSINASEFLQNSMWLSIEDKRSAGGKREKEQRIRRSGPNGTVIEYIICDDPKEFTEHHWQRVVAVFASGQPWQFKGWKYSNPVELFQLFLGAHLMLDDRAIEPNIKSWSCKVLKINKFKRHLDTAACNEFWVMLDKFTKLNKPWVHTSAQHTNK